MKRWFEYHCHEGHDSSDREAWYHSHQQVEVVRPLTDDEADMPMFRVRFADGLEWDVFGDELCDSPADFYRPDPPVLNAHHS